MTELNTLLDKKMVNKPESINSSLSSSSSSSSYSIKQSNLNNLNEKENDSGIEKDSDANTIFVRVSINDQNLQKVLKFNLDETVWNAKQRVLATLAKEIKDGLNYGFYLPPYQGRAGKFLDDCRKLREYSLNGPVAQLEFKYKKRVYKFVKINQKELKALNVKSNYKKFLDLIRTNQVQKVNRYLEKGLDPNFHSDLGETPLTIAASLADPRNMIMSLYNGGAHLDFRSRDTLTAMHKAAIIGNDKALKTLLELGAFAEVRDGRMLTPLYYSIINSSSVQSIEYLLFNGSTIGVKDDNNWQEIHHACKLGLSQHLDHLIYYGCDINAKNNSGNTPLHVCAIHNQENCTRILLFRGCNRSERNLSNQTPYDSAVISGNQLIADLIKNHRETDVVPIKERPFYNTKRRSIYVLDSQSNYSSISGQSHNLNQTHKTNLSNNEWSSNENKNLIQSSKAYSISKLDNLSNENQNYSNTNGLYAVTATSMIGISTIENTQEQSEMSPLAPPPPPPVVQPSPVGKLVNPAILSVINSGSSSPSSRSRSISSDDHGFGSASLSQISNNSPNVDYAYPRKRLYPSIPNRTFLCVKPFKPTQPGEIELKKGDVVELLSVGDSGFWEGRTLNGTEGWFKANCVEELIIPKDSNQNDTVVVKRKTLFELLTHTDLEAPRTVVLQKGKKGFGFVLRGAKTCDGKFEPTIDCPALQFLESVDKDSNAEKAGLKPLDFVLEINGVDVTCKTHLDCVKLIKKTGDTLALKVYTSKNFSSFASNLKNLTLTSTSQSALANCVYQTPSSVYSNPSMVKSHSYYATSTITNANIGNLFSSEYHSYSQSNKDLNSLYFDGTKSLPSKKKPIPPKRDPSTSLSHFNPSSSNNNNNNNNLNDDKMKSLDNKSLHKNLILTSPHAFKTSLARNSCVSLFFNEPTKSSIVDRPSKDVNMESLAYMNRVLAHIDELDKTLAEYDSGQNQDTILSSSKTKLLANDANAASIRTRVPVRKPGINNGEIFNQPILNKTLSVPNLFQVSPNIPPPPPPTVPSIPHTTHSSKNRSMVPLPQAPPPPPPPSATIPSKNNIYSIPTTTGVQNSASNDTLVQENEIDVNYEQTNEYDESHDDENLDYSSHIEPAIDYDHYSDEKLNNGSMSTFNNNNNTNNKNNLVMMMVNKNLNSNSSSPLTPRQIKQRNTAKRNTNTSICSLTPSQQVDLEFLKSQKFDQEFIHTTKDLFVRYPSAKISISITLTSTQDPSQTQNRQIEIDRLMFEKLVKSQLQPQTPIRTTSVLTTSSNYTNSYSSTSPSSGSTSSASSASAYETGLLIETPVSLKNEDLNEAIKKAAAEHLIKRQTNQIIIQTPPSSSYRAQTQNNPVKNELERALENRLKRMSLLEEASNEQKNEVKCFDETQNQTIANISTNSFPPPPSPTVLHRLNSNDLLKNKSINTANERISSPPPPPPPPPPPFLLNQNFTIQTKTTTNFVSNVKSIVTNYQLIDPRSSSDFGELIAKKAAEKRAKFHESKPTANSVTFQPDGSKVFKSNKVKADEKVQLTKGICSINNNSIVKKLNSNTNNTNLTDSVSSSQTNSSELNKMNPNRNQNESFINTASKLLERVKQHNQQQINQETNGKYSLRHTYISSNIDTKTISNINGQLSKSTQQINLIQIK